MNLKLTLLSVATLAGLQSATTVQAQPPGREDQPRTEAPHLEDGTIDLGGNGVWEPTLGNRLCGTYAKSQRRRIPANAGMDQSHVRLQRSQQR